jgi:hypothetical protein
LKPYAQRASIPRAHRNLVAQQQNGHSFSAPDKRRARIRLSQVWLKRHRQRNGTESRSLARTLSIFDFFGIEFWLVGFSNASEKFRFGAEARA